MFSHAGANRYSNNTCLRLMPKWLRSFNQQQRERQMSFKLIAQRGLRSLYKLSLETLYDKVRPGGAIMFDEYGDDRCPGATKAIDEFFGDKPETVQPHPKCSWKYHAIKQ